MTNPIISRAHNRPLTQATTTNKHGATQTLLAKTINKRQAVALLAKFDENAKHESFLKLQAQVKEQHAFKANHLARNYTLMALERIAHGMELKTPAPKKEVQAEADEAVTA